MKYFCRLSNQRKQGASRSDYFTKKQMIDLLLNLMLPLIALLCLYFSRVFALAAWTKIEFSDLFCSNREPSESVWIGSQGLTSDGQQRDDFAF